MAGKDSGLQGWVPPAFDHEGGGSLLPVPQEGGRFVALVEDLEEDGEKEAFHQAHSTTRPPGAATDFASLKVKRETTLLTNAEAYAQSVREEADLYMRQIRSEMDALNAQAELRYQEAQRVKDAADADAAALMANTQDMVDKIREDARMEGHEIGRKEAFEKRYQEAGAHLANLEALMREMTTFRRQVAYWAEKDSVRLAVLLAKKVLHQELKLNPKAVLILLSRTLAGLKGQGTFKVWVSPADYKFILEARPQLKKVLQEGQNISFAAKEDLPPANLLIETDRDVIDLTFKNQFHHIENALNQMLAERETRVTKAPASSRPAIGTGENGTPHARQQA
ncbi:MAG: FliH/SctL family protein [Deltaproteobacteria bacterium]|nr:FliH/SctL family protein [Deltaproteobacteria bacterium]